MEIPVILFSALWSYVGIYFLYFGLSTLDNTHLPDSVPPVVMFVFKTFLAVATFYSQFSYFLYHIAKRFQRWVPAELNRVLSELMRIMKKNGDVIEFSVGMVGSILFQYFFRLTTFTQVLAFFFLAVGWLANLALLDCHDDHGVFNFLLSNVTVGCTVSQFGVGWITWLVYAASLLLYILRLKLKLICFVTRDDGVAVVTWRRNQTEETDNNIVV